MVPCLSPREPALGTRLALSHGGGGGHGRPRPIQPVQIAFHGQLWPFVLPTALPALLDPCPGSDILPSPVTASWSCGGPRLPVELIRPSAGAPTSRLLTAQPPHPPGVRGSGLSGHAALSAGSGASLHVLACGWELAMGLGFAASGPHAPGPSLRPLRSSSSVHCHL